MKVCIVLGTRPEIIKMSPVIRELERRGMEHVLLHTGQHYSPNLDQVFFDELELPRPHHNLESGSGTHAEETARILIGVEKILREERPEIVLVEGDTNTVLAGALAAAKLHIQVGHVEAGLRSYDRRMPEEINRVLTDHCADMLFAPTPKARDILIGEGIDGDRIEMTGNTIVDAVQQNLKLAKRNADVLARLDIEAGGYLLITAHREENVDDRARLGGIIEALKRLHDRFDVPIIYPIHPRTRKRLKEFGLEVPPEVRIIEPVGFLQFLQLEANTRLALTDSGGVQEETCILGVPCVTLRENTERPETLEVGSNVLAGTDPERIVACAEAMDGIERTWSNPFGDGTAAVQILDRIAGRVTE